MSDSSCLLARKRLFVEKHIPYTFFIALFPYNRKYGTIFLFYIYYLLSDFFLLLLILRQALHEKCCSILEKTSLKNLSSYFWTCLFFQSRNSISSCHPFARPVYKDLVPMHIPLIHFFGKKRISLHLPIFNAFLAANVTAAKCRAHYVLIKYIGPSPYEK